jgi:uncharacterized repeat protein (TIGR01451 family)
MFKQSPFMSRPRPGVMRPLSCGLSLALGLLSAGLLLALAGGQLASGASPARPANPDVVVTTTIQAAIDAAASGASVFIPAAHYTESLTLYKDVDLIGALSSTTIIHAVSGQRVLTVTGPAINNSTVISGLTFTGGDAGVDVGGNGGGISLEGAAQPLMVNLIISGNQASGGTGGGLVSTASSPLHLVDVMVTSNTALLAGGGASLLDALTMQGGIFRNNRCTDITCRGGGLAMGSSAPLVLQDTQFFSNTSNSNGGGAYVLGPMTQQGGLFQGNTCTGPGGCYGGGLATADTLALTGTVFISNTATGYGGGINADGAVGLRDVLFQGNQCLNPDCGGGGLASGTLAMVGTRFISNTAYGFGGGGAFVGGAATVQGVLFQGNAALGNLYGGGGLFALNSLVLTDTQFIANRTAGGGGGLRTDITGTSRVVNALFAGNSAGSGGAALALSSPGAAVILHATIVSPAVASGSNAIAVLSGKVGITNSLIASYTVGISRTAGTIVEDYNLFSGVAITTTDAVAHGGHSHTGPAGFRNPAAGDYHLAVGSAAINTGTNAGVTADFEGDSRPIGAGPDIGYDEARLVALVLSKTDGQSTVQSGASLAYTILVTNTGPYTATGVVVSDNLPASLTGASWTCLASAGSSCPAGGNGSINTLVTVAGGSFVQITLHATVSPSANGTIINTVSAAAPAGLVNTNAANNSATDSTTIIGGPQQKLYLPLVLR